MTSYRIIEKHERRRDGTTLVALAPVGRGPLHEAAHAVALWCGDKTCGIKNVVATVNHTEGTPALDIAALRCPSCGGPLEVTSYCQELFFAPVEGPALAGAKSSHWVGWSRSSPWEPWRCLARGPSWLDAWRELDRRAAGGDRLVIPSVVDPNRFTREDQLADGWDQGKQRGMPMHRSARNNAWLEDRADGSKRIVGYAAVFYNPTDEGTQYQLWQDASGRAVERIMPTAFDRAMKDLDDCRALVNHNPGRLLGRIDAGSLRLTVDRRGLRYEISPPSTVSADEVLESIRRLDLTGSSFTFTVDRDGQRWVEQGDLVVREVHSVSGLFDVGPVTYPAYQSTTASIRSDGPRAARWAG
jgi:HK97 family phage prohead protease